MTLAKHRKVWKWGLASVLSVFAAAAFLSRENRYSEYVSSQYWASAAERTAGLAAIPVETMTQPLMISAAEPQDSEQASSPGPMIIRTVSLKVAAIRVSDTRSKIESVISRFQGYIDTLATRSDVGLPYSISATLRIPAGQLQPALAELKSLGRVIEESETSQDATAGYTDLVARLSNARRTEQRLLILLGERTGKLGEIVQVEKEIGEVREGIERMETQQRRVENQVRYASVKLELTEGEGQFSITRARIQTAITDGYQTAIANTIDLTLAVLRYGPTVVLYFVLLLPLVIVAWRRSRFVRKTA